MTAPKPVARVIRVVSISTGRASTDVELLNPNMLDGTLLYTESPQLDRGEVAYQLHLLSHGFKDMVTCRALVDSFLDNHPRG